MMNYLGRAGIQSHELPVLILIPHVGRLEAALQVLKEPKVSKVSEQIRLRKTRENGILVREPFKEKFIPQTVELSIPRNHEL